MSYEAVAQTLTIKQPPNPWARISEIAGKLGVEPIEHGHPATITCKGADGNSYDLWEVVSKFLDAMQCSGK